jgi:two-component system, cell cycle sensor histidine kinase and response regulator CckA
MKYGYRFLFLFCLVCLCGYLFFAFYEGAKSAAIEELNARQTVHAQQAAREIEGFFAAWTERLNYLAGDEAIVSLNDLGKKEMLFFLAAHKADIKGVTRVDAKGRIAHTVPYVKKSIGADITHQKHIREIMNTHKPVVSDVFSAVQGFDTIALHVPVFRGSRYDGTISILIDFKTLAKRYLEDIRIGKTGYAWMTSRDGIELYCPVPGHTGQSVFDNCREFPSIIAMAGDMLKGKRGTTTYTFDMIMGQSVQTVQKYAVYMPVSVGNTFWSIVVASSEDEVLASLRNFRNRLLVVVIVLVLSVAVFSYYGMKGWGIVQEEKKRRLAEEELRESERRLADIINFLPDAILAIDREGKIIAWNRAIEEMTGFSAGAMLGQGDYEYAIPFYGKRRPILINFVGGWDNEMEREYSIIKKDGETLYAETDAPSLRGEGRALWVKAGPLYDTRGNVIGAIESIRDVTERKRVEEAVRESEKRFKAIFDSSFQFTGLMTPEGTLIEANRTALDFAGIGKEEAIGRPFWETRWWAGNDTRVAQLKDAIARAAEGEFVRYEVELQGTGDVTATIDFSIKPVSDPDGKVRLLIPEGRDVTERKKLETQLMNAQKMEAIGTLSGGVAHDFNNILMVIQGHASLMVMDIDRDHPHYDGLKQIEEQVKNAADLTRQLLGFARGGKYVVKPVSMNDLIEKTSALFGRTKKEIAIHCKYERNVWSVDADRGQLEQVLLNLYLNAWQAMPSGGDLSLETRNIVIGEDYTRPYPVPPGRYVMTSVSDTGIGMNEKVRERIFEPFFTTKELGRGTGLGLAMVYGIIKNHNGFIDVISEPGKGATFVFCLPLSEGNVTKEKPASSEIRRGTGTILLVDDEAPVLEVSRAILESLGYKVHSAASGEEAVALYKERKGEIGLVILDMIMPGLSGDETFDSIRAFDPGARLILSSGYSLNRQGQGIMDKGCLGFIQKPFDVALISRVIGEALERQVV